MSGEPLLRVEELAMHFPVTAGVFGRAVAHVKAVDGVTFELRRGRTLGLVGESGCGKTTVGESVVRLLEPTRGRVVFEGRDITHAPQGALRDLRRELQIVFQDPFGSLNPRMTVADIVGESLEVHGIARGREAERRVVDVLARVGVPAAWMNRYPHEFSGGQRQRISIARAIALEPKLVVCDEAVSALDVSIQAQVINLLIDLQREMDLAYLFISHDLSVVRHISDDVAVMYLGQIVESAPAEELFARPAHPYSRSLLSAIPVPDPTRRRHRVVLEGDVPTPLDPPPGCRFHTRCPAVISRCHGDEPPSFDVGGEHAVKCWHAEGLAQERDWFPALERRIEEATATKAKPAATAPRASRFAFASERAKVARQSGDSRGLRTETKPPRVLASRVAAVVGGIGAIGVLLGYVLFGSFVALAALAAWRRTESGMDSPAWHSGLWIVALVAGVLGSRGLAGLERDREALAQLEGLRSAVIEVSEIRGAPPSRLADLGWRLPAVFPTAERVDPWGHAWRYRVPGADGRVFDLGSVGPDGVPASGDEIGDSF